MMFGLITKKIKAVMKRIFFLTNMVILALSCNVNTSLLQIIHLSLPVEDMKTFLF
jgi:hypothetical protein